MTFAVPVRRPTRHGRALRRLRQGKTTTVVWHVAVRLQADGLVSFTEARTGTGSRASVGCRLTEAGEREADKAIAGENPYVGAKKRAQRSTSMIAKRRS